MPFNTLISTDELANHLADPDWAVIDCRYALGDDEWGRQQYLKQHIPGSVYAHLKGDLSSRIVPGQTGRHPWPEVEPMTERLSHRGLDESAQVVAYDDGSGAMAGRLWWICRWLGHDAVAVLEGGWRVWSEAGLPTVRGEEHRPARRFRAQPKNDLIVAVNDVCAHLADPARTLIDSRAPQRYRGQQEPIDPIAGRIPGAVNRFHANNLSPDGKFLSPKTLRSQWRDLLAGRDPEQVVFYCGSGVSATVNLLAFAHAGLHGARLYPGSWSEWITDPSRPVETG